jgi:hypothetical protein
MPSSGEQYPVYKLKTQVDFPDPDIAGTRYHHILFVRTNPDGSGMRFHVTGDITSGMRYESQEYGNPQNSDTPPDSMELLGYTPAEAVMEKWDAVLSQQPPPPKQKAFNVKTMKTEPVKSWEPLVFYQPGEPRRPLWKCTEWTEYQALPALHKANLIQDVSAHDAASTSCLSAQLS